ncbi:MAG: Uma2 family endonuclease [Cyanobacteria bacterium P01_A01_bin.37]
MQAISTPITYEDYLSLPFTGQKTEYVDGEIVKVNPPTRKHIDIADNLYFWLRQHIHQIDLPLICRQSSAQVAVRYQGRKRRGLLPDLFVCLVEPWEAIALDTSAVFPVGSPPSLVVEILSPGNWRTDISEKEADYATARVPEYWRINPMDGWIDVLTLGKANVYEVNRFSGKDQLSSREFPELTLTAQQILDI